MNISNQFMSVVCAALWLVGVDSASADAITVNFNDAEGTGLISVDSPSVPVDNYFEHKYGVTFSNATLFNSEGGVTSLLTVIPAGVALGYFAVNGPIGIDLDYNAASVTIWADDEWYPENHTVIISAYDASGDEVGSDSYSATAFIRGLSSAYYVPLTVTGNNITDIQLTSDVNNGVVFNDLAITAMPSPIPEPTILVLLTTGLVGLGLTRRYRALVTR